jgi:hypothetical protein
MAVSKKERKIVDWTSDHYILIVGTCCFCVFIQGISKIRVEPEFTKGLLQKINGPQFSEEVFDVVQARVSMF